MIDGAAEAADNSEARPGMGDARVDLQAAIGGADSQDVLRRGLVRPGGRPRKPAVARQPELRMFVTQDILRINVWFALVFVDRVVLARRVDLAVVLKGPITMPRERFGDDHPEVGVQEDTTVFLGSRRIGRDAAFQ